MFLYLLQVTYSKQAEEDGPFLWQVPNSKQAGADGPLFITIG